MSFLISHEPPTEPSPAQRPSSKMQPAVYRLRCPNCQKLFSVHGEGLRNARAPLRFHCDPTQIAGCGTRFASSLEWGLTTGDLVVTREIFEERAPVAALRAPLVVPAAKVLQAPCPKCNSKNALAATECRSCGVVFAKFKPRANDGPEAETKPELVQAWERVFADYENLALHESFVSACHKAGLLGFASQKYARILSAVPQEEIARSMRARIVALVSIPATTSTIGAPWRFRVPGFNNLCLVLGGALTVMGLMLPQVPHLTGLGVACVALCAGLRYALRPL